MLQNNSTESTRPGANYYNIPTVLHSQTFLWCVKYFLTSSNKQDHESMLLK